MFPLLLCPWELFDDPDIAPYSEWGHQALSVIAKSYVDPQGRHCEWVDGKGNGSKEPAFLWGMGVTLSAYAAAGRAHEHGSQNRFRKAWDLVRTYGTGKLSDGLSVWPGLSEPDRYYDDNAWVCLALVEAGVWFKRPEYTKAAAELFKYVLSGEDAKLDGGIYWREREKTSKNTCSNAPAALVSYKLDKALKDPTYRKVGDRLTAWLDRLQDVDGLYFDAMRLDGSIEKTKWSYNAALPIRARLARYSLLRSRKDLDEAKRIAEAARARWIDPKSGLLKDDASFAHHLAEAFLELGRATGDHRWEEVAFKALEGLHDQIRTPYHELGTPAGQPIEGLYGKWWDRRQPEGDRFLLLYQSSAARAFYMAAASDP